MIDWQQLLKQWSRELLQSRKQRGLFSPDVVESGWLGYPAASEDEIAQAGLRLATTLPPSYRSFLRVTNGWRQTGNLAGPLWPSQNIEWFRLRHQQDLIDPFLLGYHYFGKQPSIPDQEYFIYGDEHNPFSYFFREDHLGAALEIGDVDSGVYLLNPLVISPDAEWEAWYFEPELGVRRYPSFERMMQGEYEWFLRAKALSESHS